MEEQSLVIRAQGGDRDAFGVLYDMYVKRIYAFVYHKTHHKETAEDLTSTAFFKALDSIGSFDSAKAFGPWLYAIARNTVTDHFRRHRPTVGIDDVWDLRDEDADVLVDADMRLRLRDVKALMSTLSATQREIITLRLWEGLSYREIAAIIGGSEDSAKAGYSRAIRKLRAALPLSAFLLFIQVPSL